MPLGQSHRPGQYAETKGYLPVQRFKCVLTARPHMARAQDGSLLLSCMTLSFTTSRRFIPTLSSHEWLRRIILHGELTDLALQFGDSGGRHPAPADRRRAFHCRGNTKSAFESHWVRSPEAW